MPGSPKPSPAQRRFLAALNDLRTDPPALWSTRRAALHQGWVRHWHETTETVEYMGVGGAIVPMEGTRRLTWTHSWTITAAGRAALDRTRKP
jgi:hypothetical protein